MPSVLKLAVVLLLSAGCTSTPTNPNPQPPAPPPTGPLALERIGHGDGQQELEGNPLPGRLEVRVTRGGVPQLGVTVEWSTTSGSLNHTASTTSITGVTYARLTVGTTPGEVLVTARVRGETATEPVTFRAVVLERVAATREPGGSGQTGEVGTTLPIPLRVRVSRNGVPRAGVPVAWQSSYGTISASSPTTDAEGYAEARWTLGTRPSSPVAAALVTGAPQSVVFNATAVAGPPESFSASAPDDLPANDYEAAPGIWLKDQFGNNAAGTPLAWEVLGGPATLRWADENASTTGWAYAGVDPTGTPGNIRVRVRSLTNNFQHTFTFSATPPSYRIQIYEETWVSGWPQFFSTRNWTRPVVDTVPVGATVTWWLLESEIPGLNGSYTVEAVGTPNFSGGIVQRNSDLTVVFGQPGTYRYRLSELDEFGTLVVQ